jgi:DNA-binding YbaB/EbfC family protein
VSQPPFDLGELMKQARDIQSRLASVQERLKHRTVEATVGGGTVTATVNGKLEVVALRIDPAAVDPRDAEMLQDLVIAAVNEGLRRARDVARTEFQQATGLPLPDLWGGA